MGCGCKPSAMHIYTHHHKCRRDTGDWNKKAHDMKKHEKLGRGRVPSLITVGMTSPTFCCRQLLDDKKNTSNAGTLKMGKQGTVSKQKEEGDMQLAHEIGKCAKTSKP